MVFDKKTTGMLKGVALILMFAHHLFGFPEWLLAGNTFLSIPFQTQTTAYFLGKFGNICVGMFMFLTGYGIFYSYKKGNCFSYSIKKILTFLAQYWIMLFTFFIPVELLCGVRDYSLSFILKEMFAISVRIVNFAWYVRFYVLAMLTMPVLKKILSKKTGAVIILIYWILCIGLRQLAQIRDMGMFYTILEEYLRFMPTVILGYLFAQYDLFNRLNSALVKIKLGNAFTGLIICGAVYVLRVKFLKETYPYLPSTDFFLTPLYIYGLIKLLNTVKFKPVEKTLCFIGAHSMNLWFLQSVFYGTTGALQFIAYMPKGSVLILAWSIICLLPVSWVYNKIFNKLFRG